MNDQEREALERIRAWASHYKDEACSQQRSDDGTGRFGDPYTTSDGSDDPNRASAEAEGARALPPGDRCLLATTK